MNLLLACRVCLAHDIRLFSIKDGQFRDIYEKLVEASLDTEDMLPTSVCYICFASMKKMLQFRNRSQKANQLLQRMISSGLELTFSSLDMLVKYQTGITWSLKISEVERTTTTSAEDEVKVKIESVESEMGIDGTSDWNEAADLARTPMYPFPGSIPVPCPISLSPEMSETKHFLSHNLQQHTPSMDPISSAASGFRSPYPTSPIPSSSLSSELNRFSPTLDGDLGLEPLSKAEIDSFQSHYERSLEMGSSSSSSDNPAESSAANSEEQNKNVEEFATITSQPHIKKPLNAFMLYMKEMRAKVAAECNSTVSSAINQTLGKQWKALSREEQAKYYEKARQELKRHMQLYPGWRISKKMSRELGCSSFATITSQPHIKKPLNAFMLYMKEMRPKVAAECNSTESSAINQILGKQWHALGSEEQAKYYELARRERLLHKQLYPGWSSRGRKRRRRGAKDPSDAANILKKCRARYGLDQQDQWCEPCKRKKKCVRYMEALAAAAGSAARPMATPQSPCSEEDVKLIMEELLDASDDDGDVDTPLNSASSPASDPPPAPPHPVGTNPRDASYPLSVSQLLRAFRTGIDKHTRPLSPKYMSN